MDKPHDEVFERAWAQHPMAHATGASTPLMVQAFKDVAREVWDIGRRLEAEARQQEADVARLNNEESGLQKMQRVSNSPDKPGPVEYRGHACFQVVPGRSEFMVIAPNLAQLQAVMQKFGPKPITPELCKPVRIFEGSAHGQG